MAPQRRLAPGPDLPRAAAATCDLHVSLLILAGPAMGPADFVTGEAGDSLQAAGQVTAGGTAACYPLTDPTVRPAAM